MSLSFQAKAAGVGALAGLAISGFLYTSLAPMQPAAATTPAAVTTSVEPVVVHRDCTPPAVLEGEICVTHVPAAEAAAAGRASSMSGPSTDTSGSGQPAATQLESEHGSEQASEYESEYESDHGDD